jgi:hypothetical protein
MAWDSSRHIQEFQVVGLAGESVYSVGKGEVWQDWVEEKQFPLCWFGISDGVAAIRVKSFSN